MSETSSGSCKHLIALGKNLENLTIHQPMLNWHGRIIESNETLQQENTVFGGEIMGQILFFDCETPNHRNDRISQMGIIIDRDGKEIFRKSYLINPEEPFDEFNVKLTHITPQMVSDKPTFPEIWPEISNYFNESLLVAHNAKSADLSYLNKVVQHYRLDIKVVQFIDTMRSPFGYDGPLRLDALCDFYGIDLSNHHDAFADAEACRSVFYKLNEERPWTKDDQETYWFHEIEKHAGADVKESAFADLSGLLAGISFDEEIDEDEMQVLKKWLENNQYNGDCEEFKEVFTIINHLLERRVLNAELYNQLSAALDHGSRQRYSSVTHELQKLKGMLSGVSADKTITAEEAFQIEHWMESHSELQNNYPFSTIFSRLKEVLKDGVLTELESEELYHLFDKFVDPLKYQDQEDNNEIEIADKNVCLTGTFDYGDKSSVKKCLSSKGAHMVDSVTKTTDLLIVGGQGSTSWSMGNYGEKVKKALRMQEKGSSIKIIAEKDIQNLLS
ncbi:exonuclease domain-containing protein [Galactobacillus timonensis]|uniref:exonuclease domain-containing protein n=1 Tax=Galactobacillus timonensis TaxID=2041840 RepID=UPI000C82F1A4|nr:exonuclease domain-containing protein [Galactobacillus timonensis]